MRQDGGTYADDMAFLVICEFSSRVWVSGCSFSIMFHILLSCFIYYYNNKYTIKNNKGGKDNFGSQDS